MKKLTIVTDKVVYKDSKNNFYSSGGFARQVEGFLPYYDELVICTKVEKTNEIKLLQPLNSLILVDELLSFKKRKSFRISYLFKHLLLINEYSNEWNDIQLRMPSVSSLLAYFILRIKKNKNHRIYSYVGGHPYQGIKHTKKGLSGFFVANINHIISISIFKNHQTFVTGDEIFKDYKKYNVKKIISTTLSNEEILRDEDLVIKNNDTINAIFIGRLSKEKGVDTLLKAVDIIKSQQHIQLTIIGDGPEKLNLMNLVTDLKLNDFVEFKGLVTNRKDLQKHLDKSEMFILPSLTEGTPKVLLEAMSRGIPVIASNVGGIPSVITNEENGIMFDAGNVKQLSNIILDVHSDPNQRKRLALNGLKFSRGNTLNQLSEYINNNLNK